MHVNYILYYVSIGCELYTHNLYINYTSYLYLNTERVLSIFMLHVLIYSCCFSAFYLHLIIYAATLSTQDIQTSLILLDGYRAGHCGGGLTTFLSTPPLMGIWLTSGFSLLYWMVQQAHELFLFPVKQETNRFLSIEPSLHSQSE